MAGIPREYLTVPVDQQQGMTWMERPCNQSIVLHDRQGEVIISDPARFNVDHVYLRLCVEAVANLYHPLAVIIVIAV